MKTPDKPVSSNGMIILLMVLINILILKLGFTRDSGWYNVLLFSMPLLLIAIFQKSPEYKSNYNKKIDIS